VRPEAGRWRRRRGGRRFGISTGRHSSGAGDRIGGCSYSLVVCGLLEVEEMELHGKAG
jgi:hypothetical protein